MTLKEALLFYDEEIDSNEEVLTDYLQEENMELKQEIQQLKEENKKLKFINGLLKALLKEVDL